MRNYNKFICFCETTLVSTTNGAKRIKDIRVGDNVVSYDDKLNEVYVDTVTHTAESAHNICAIIMFDNGTTLKATVDHPLMVAIKGWCAVSTDGIEKMYGVCVKQLEVGDECMMCEGDKVSVTTVTSIEVIPCSEIFYCLATKKTHNFLANGIVARGFDLNSFSKKSIDQEGVKVHYI